MVSGATTPSSVCMSGWSLGARFFVTDDCFPENIRSQRHRVGVQAGGRAAPVVVRRDCLRNLLRRARARQLQDLQTIPVPGRLRRELHAMLVAAVVAASCDGRVSVRHLESGKFAIE